MAEHMQKIKIAKIWFDDGIESPLAVAYDAPFHMHGVNNNFISDVKIPPSKRKSIPAKPVSVVTVHENKSVINWAHQLPITLSVARAEIEELDVEAPLDLISEGSILFEENGNGYIPLKELAIHLEATKKLAINDNTFFKIGDDEITFWYEGYADQTSKIVGDINRHRQHEAKTVAEKSSLKKKEQELLNALTEVRSKLNKS